jgi:NAD(P)-dependent dehydrogenase (short-subunit alcohol dehydrogenase family)
MHGMQLTPATGVVVTGGASGIGKACAAALAAAGRPVACWDRNADAARAAASTIGKEFGVGTTAIGIDVTQLDAFDAAIDESRSALGSLGGLVHAAGIVLPQPIGAVDWRDWDATLAVNLTAAAQLVQALLPDLRRHESSAVVAIASIEALIGHEAIPAYCASKAGLVGLTRSLAMALGPAGIRVNAVCPGYIETPMTAPALADPDARARFERSSVLGRIGRPDDVGRVVRFLMSDESAFVTGVALPVDGGVTAID